MTMRLFSKANVQTHLHSRKEMLCTVHTQNNKRPFLLPSIESNRTWERDICCTSFCVGILDGSPGKPQHKRSQMYFLTTEVRRAPHQRQSSPQCLEERGNHQTRRPLMGEPKAWTSYSLSDPRSPRAAVRQNRAHSSIINRLTDTLCHNNNSVAQSRDELKRSSTPHYRHVFDGLMLAKSGRVYVQGRLKGIGSEEMGAWRDLTFTDPSRSSEYRLLGCQAHANVDKLFCSESVRRRLLSKD